MAAKSKKTPPNFQEEYIKHLLVNGHRPKSVYAFCSDLGVEEKRFYEEWSSFEHLESSIWKQMVESTITTLQSDGAFPSYTAREKSLAFYFTFFQDAIQYRSFIEQRTASNIHNPMEAGASMNGARKVFFSFMQEIINQGMTTGEIAGRMRLNEQYPKLMWMQFMFLMTFWIKDQSVQFEKTDAAIEKSVNLWFDLIQRGAIESAIDFGRFLMSEAKSTMF